MDWGWEGICFLTVDSPRGAAFGTQGLASVTCFGNSISSLQFFFLKMPTSFSILGLLPISVFQTQVASGRPQH